MTKVKTQAEKIEKYVRECFEEFKLNYNEFFCYIDYDEDDKEITLETAWEDEDGSVNLDAIKHASMSLGISVDDILSTNDSAIMEKLKEFPYVIYRQGFDFAYEKTFYGEEFDKIHLIETIFDVKSDQPYPSRYNIENIKERLLSELKKMDKLIPGTYHTGCSIKKLDIVTRNFCTFDKINELINSYISMVYSAKELFVKTIKSGLSEKEILTYNFLVSVFGIRDKYVPRRYLYYNELIKLNDLYNNITPENFFDYIIFKRIGNFEPWKCSDFVKNEALVRKYLEIFPEAKRDMGKYAMEALNFLCIYTWSDSEVGDFDLSEAIYMHSLFDDFDFKEEERPALPERFYIRKTVQELDGDNVVAEKLMRYSRSEKLGGIPVKYSAKYSAKYSNTDMVKHMEYLIKKKVKSNNYIENAIYEYNDNSSSKGENGDE